VVAQDLHVGVAYRGARFHAEFVQEAGPEVPVDGQGLGLAAGAVQDEHEETVEGLPERVLGDQGGEFGGEGAERVRPGGVLARRTGREVEFGLVPPLQQQQPCLLQALDEGLGAEFLDRQTAERCPAPEGEGGGALAYRPGPVPLGVGGAGGARVGLEDADVQLAVVDPQQIARRDRAQPLGVVQQPAQARHMVLQGRLRGRGWRRVPEHVLQGVDGDDPPGFEQQRDEQGPHLSTADGPYAAGGDALRLSGGSALGTPDGNPLGTPAGDWAGACGGGVTGAHGPAGGSGLVQDRRTEQSEPQPVPHRTAAAFPHRRSGPAPRRPAAASRTAPRGTVGLMLAIRWRDLM
jgi:hypothetical protein